MSFGVSILSQATEGGFSEGVEKILQSQESLVYYAICGIFFVLCGLACGYFIWRKGHMQMLDAELEVRRTENELSEAEEDLKLEEQEVTSSEVSRAS